MCIPISFHISDLKFEVCEISGEVSGEVHYGRSHRYLLKPSDISIILSHVSLNILV